MNGHDMRMYSRHHQHHRTPLVLIVIVLTLVSMIGQALSADDIVDASADPNPETLDRLWPKPTSTTGCDAPFVNVSGVVLTSAGTNSATIIAAFERMSNFTFGAGVESSSGEALQVDVVVADSSDSLALDTDESYQLVIDAPIVQIKANTMYGAMYGLETLSQLIKSEDNLGFSKGQREVVSRCRIDDVPRFKHRGLMIDSARNFLEVSDIKRTIDALAMNKMNVLHWHLIDSQSFPFESTTWPELYTNGRYREGASYSVEDVQEIVLHGKERGVRIIPEFDAPGHAYKGWNQLASNYGEREITVCGAYQPWQDACVEPPCGQLDPSNNFTYTVLEGLFNDIVAAFPDEYIHLGADEVNVNCWNMSESIRDYMGEQGYPLTREGYFEGLWDEFNRKEMEIVKSHGRKSIQWNDILKDGLDVNPEYTILQVWLSRDDLLDTVEAGFQTILSNHEAWYLDCGAGNSITFGTSWCDPFKTWKVMYENEPLATIPDESLHSLVLGGEACMWGEQTGPSSLDQTVWPRTSAVGERLWSAADVNDYVEAYGRLQWMTQRMIERGINANMIGSEYCMYNPKECNNPFDDTTMMTNDTTTEDENLLVSANAGTSTAGTTTDTNSSSNDDSSSSSSSSSSLLVLGTAAAASVVVTAAVTGMLV